MAKDVDFELGTPVHQDWLDAQQEVESALAWGVRLVKTSQAVLTVPVAVDGSPGGAASIRINGKPRWRTTSINYTLPNGLASGVYSIFAIEPVPPAFEITHVAGAAPTPPANSRKIGEIDVIVGSPPTITAVRNLIDAVPGHGDLHRAGVDPLGPLSITGRELADGAVTMAKLAQALKDTLIPPGMIQQWPTNTPPPGWYLLNGQVVLAADNPTLATIFGQNAGNVTLPDARGRVLVGAGPIPTSSPPVTLAVGEMGGAHKVALAVGELPAHAHGINDPTHAHSATATGAADRGLGTTIDDRDHAHNIWYDLTGASGSGRGVIRAPGEGQYATGTGGRNTGHYHGTTDHLHGPPGIYAAATGISVQSSGSNGPHENMPPYLAVNSIIKGG
jgi:microcystin-dependent protein